MAPAPRSLRELARAWLVIGATSLGGGTSTLYLMRRELVQRRQWLSQREFLEDWALSKLSLGINQVALTGLEGLRVAGVRGLAVSLGAFLIPAGLITALMTAGYALVRDEPLVRAALGGAAPAVAGMTVGVSYQFASGSVRRAWRGVLDRGYWLLVVALGAIGVVSPIEMIVAGAIVGVMFLRGEPRRAAADPETT